MSGYHQSTLSNSDTKISLTAPVLLTFPFQKSSITTQYETNRLNLLGSVAQSQFCQRQSKTVQNGSNRSKSVSRSRQFPSPLTAESAKKAESKRSTAKDALDSTVCSGALSCPHPTKAQPTRSLPLLPSFTKRHRNPHFHTAIRDTLRISYLPGPPHARPPAPAKRPHLQTFRCSPPLRAAGPVAVVPSVPWVWQAQSLCCRT